ncbi:hypothetical protein EYF80_027414 [Liparis tanakae]|uniref:Uncharacterized protein n=1 Tax=Liparis tanakae TaxID=230148 RepID=A0A4Z2HBM3_9TELE|nr:hypothetical protein EYF80_027414 [Liparis tanakae]
MAKSRLHHSTKCRERQEGERESKETSRVKKESRGDIRASSRCRRVETGGRRGRPVLDQQGPSNRHPTRANLVVH